MVLCIKPTLSPPIRVLVPHTWCVKGKLQLSSLTNRPPPQVFSWYSKAPTLFAFFFRRESQLVAWTRPRPVLISPLFGRAPGRGPSQACSGKAVESATPAYSRRSPQNPGKGPSCLGPFSGGRCGGRSSVATTDPLSRSIPRVHLSPLRATFAGVHPTRDTCTMAPGWPNDRNTSLAGAGGGRGAGGGVG